VAEDQKGQFDDLSEKQRLFCVEYCTHWNATKAAISAGYSQKTAYSIGFENLRKPEIKAYIQHLKDNLAEAAGISALRNLRELAKIAYSNVSDIKKDWDNEKDWDEIDDDTKAAISEMTNVNIVISEKRGSDKENVTSTKRVTRKIKMHSKIAAIQEINKMLGYAAQPEEPKPVSVIVNFSDEDDSE